jgi:hypothetical protein
MTRLLRPLSITFVAPFIACFLFAQNRANAGFELQITYVYDGSTYQSQIYNDSSSPGSISVSNYSLPFGTLTVSATDLISQSKSSLDLQVGYSANLNSSGKPLPSDLTSLKILATMINITTAPAPQTLQYQLTGGTSVKTMQTWIDQNNNYFGITGSTNSDIVANTNPKYSIGLQTLGFSASPFYSLTTEIAVNSSTFTSLDMDDGNSICPSPTPSSLLLILVGLPIIGFRIRQQLRPVSTLSQNLTTQTS